MFLRVKDMEVRKVRFDETFEPGRIDFTDEDIEQGSPLHAAGSAEALEDSEGQVRILGRYTVEMEAQCDRCLGAARFPLNAAFDLFYMPASVLAGAEEVEIDEGEAEIGFQQVSELLPIAGADFVGQLPLEVQKITVFSAGIATAAREPVAGKALIAFLASPAAAPSLKKSGLEPVAAALAK